ncbi:MAG: YqaJ viral recombinase family protein [Actinomycetota bacterium]|nr:YqaJ viral recombinase family protein [Actinomycetota bacterium]
MKAERVASTVGLSRDEWLAIRRTGIGSSDIAGVLGLSPWASPYTVWADKRGLVPPVEQTEAMEVGTELEEPIARLFQRRHGRPVRRVRAILRHPDYPFALANLDRVTDGGRSVVEIKATGQRWDGVPDHYMVQVQWQLGVTGLRRGYLVPLMGTRLAPVTIERDDDLIHDMLTAATEFWRMVEGGIEPGPTASEGDARIMALLHPGDPNLPPLELQDNHQAEVAFLNYLEAKNVESRAKHAKEEAANVLRSILGDHTKATFAGRTVATWSRYTERRLDTKALEAECPDIYARFVRQSSKQAFRVYGGSEAE